MDNSIDNYSIANSFESRAKHAGNDVCPLLSFARGLVIRDEFSQTHVEMSNTPSNVFVDWRDQEAVERDCISTTLERILARASRRSDIFDISLLLRSRATIDRRAELRQSRYGRQLDRSGVTLSPSSAEVAECDRQIAKAFRNNNRRP